MNKNTLALVIALAVSGIATCNANDVDSIVESTVESTEVKTEAVQPTEVTKVTEVTEVAEVAVQPELTEPELTEQELQKMLEELIKAQEQEEENSSK